MPGARALVFNTGFQANLTVVSALGERLGGVFADKYAHASVAEGLRVLPRTTPFHRFAHNDVDHLETLLKAHQPAAGGLVVAETLYSMDGDTAPFEALCALQKRYGFWMLLDEAHSTAAWPGLHSQGFNGIPERTLLLGTFGKALGSFGATCWVRPRFARRSSTLAAALFSAPPYLPPCSVRTAPHCRSYQTRPNHGAPQNWHRFQRLPAQN
jgi:7-keto-8-aminopelargonate synthetase-like enzyme